MMKDFKIAIRNIRRFKTVSLINIFGLSVGVSACLLMMMYVVNETRYEDFHVNKDRIFRVALEWGQKGNRMKFAGAMPGLAPAMASEFPEVEAAVRVVSADNLEMRAAAGAAPLTAKTVLFVEPGFLGMFSYPWRHGDPGKALRSPFTAVLTASLARRLYGVEDAVGRIALLEDKPVVVSGVMADPPLNTHLRPDLLLSYATYAPLFGQPDSGWGSFGSTRTYVLLRGRTDIPSLQAKLKDLAKKNVAPGMAEVFTFHVQPLQRLHWITDFMGDYLSPKGNRAYFYIFIWASALMLIIACFNFISLTASQNLERMREMGVRHALGATRGQLVGQLLRESLVFAVSAMIIGGVILELSFKPLMAFIGAPIVLTRAHVLPAVGVLAAVFLAALAAGIVPAWTLARYKPAEIIGKGKSRPRPIFVFRKALFALQFVITIALLIATLVVERQMSFAMNSDLGFDKNDALIIPARGDSQISARYDLIRQELEKNPVIRRVSSTSAVPGDTGMANMKVYAGPVDPSSGNTVQPVSADEGYIEALGLSIVAGRDFSRQAGGDLKRAALVNETAVRSLGLKNPIGATLKIPSGDDYWEMTIIGVVKDFHVRSLHHAINPMLLLFQPGRGGSILVRYRPGQRAAALDFVRRTLAGIVPEEKPDIRFLDENYARGYRSEDKTGKLLMAFSILAVILSCAGLMGLSAYSIGRRVKEIGIRKVLGAKPSQIVLLLSREYLLIVGLANVVAWPIAYYAMGRWLMTFAYRTSLGVVIFVLAGAAAFLVALLTVSLRAAKAAQTDPAESLRYE